MKIKYKLNNAAIYALLAVLLIFALFPVYWMINTSFKTNEEIYLRVPTFWPQDFVFAAYGKLLKETMYLISIRNSLFVSIIVSLFSIIISMLAAYSIARLKIKGRTAISRSVLYTYLLPKTLLFIPLYMMASLLNVNNSMWGLLILYPTFTIPYAMWMLIVYFKTIPKEMEESAMVDGCGPVRTMLSIFFPLVIPGIISTFIFCFTLCWNEYLYAFITISNSSWKTFPLMLTDFMTDDVYAWGPLMAGSALSCVPVLLIYTFSSKHLVTGITMGAVKQ